MHARRLSQAVQLLLLAAGLILLHSASNEGFRSDSSG